MKIGIISFFAFRPHVSNLAFLGKVLENGGHECSYLMCDKDLESCYNLETKRNFKTLECTKCKFGSINTYQIHKKVDSLKISNFKSSGEEKFDNIVQSSVATIFRIENDSGLQDSDTLNVVKRLSISAEKVYQKTINWIQENNLEAVICFNGRMDLTKASIAACTDINIPFVTTESTWFGNGLLIIPNDSCLSLIEWDRFNEEYKNKPLTLSQAKHAASIISKRILKKSFLEWRQYNLDSKKSIQWDSSKKVLILPSSRSEFIGNPEFDSGWSDDVTIGYESVIEHLGIPYSSCILKSHPVWQETIFGVKGEREEKYYRDWSEKREIRFLDSNSKIDAFELISMADIVIINGSTAAIEAGILGKVTICLSPMIYRNAGFCIHVTSKDELKKLNNLHVDREQIIRRTLRFLYTASRRIPQYVDNVKGIEVTKNEYFGSPSSSTLIDIFKTGRLTSFDNEWNRNQSEEDLILDSIENKRWEELANFEIFNYLPEDEIKIEKRLLYRVIDVIRPLFPRGDKS